MMLVYPPKGGHHRLNRIAAVAAVVAITVTSLTANSSVADAAKAGDVAAVKAMLKNGGDVNAAHGDGMTALHWAASRGDAALAQMLLSAGANIRATTRLGGITPLHMASQGGHAQVVAALMAAGADSNTPTTTGATAVMLAARVGSTDTVTRLVETGADVNAKEKAFGQTALMIAAGLDRADVVRLLLARGADWKAASSVADLKAMTSMMDDGTGRPQQQQPGGGVAGVTRGYRYNELIGTQGGLTALHFAARQGSAASARALVEGGADLNLVSPGDRATPLLVALINGHFDLAAMLLERGADPNLVSDAGVSPLYATLNVQWAPIAAYPQPRSHLQQTRTYLEMVQLLLERGADPNARVRHKVWYSGYNFDQSGVDEAGATPVLAGCLRRRRRRHEAAGVAWRGPVDSHHEAVLETRPRRSGGRRRQVRTAGVADRRARCDTVACGGGARLRDGLCRQLASRGAVRHAAGGEVSRRGTGCRRRRRRSRRQHRGASRRVARRQRDDRIPGREGRGCEEDQSLRPDHD